jgi:hypothetical protein
LQDTTEEAKEILSEIEEKDQLHSPAAAPQITGQYLEPFLHLSSQLLHLAHALYFQVRFELFHAFVAVSTDSCVETAFHRDECNAALHLAGSGQKTTGDFLNVQACSQCSRGVDVFVGHDGSLETRVIDAAVNMGPYMTLKGSNYERRDSFPQLSYS